VSFRALSSMTAMQTHRVLAAASLAVEFSRWIDERYGTPETSLPDFSEMPGLGPTTLAEHLRSHWRLHEKPIKNMLGLLERKGIRVFALPAPDREVDAFSFYREGRPFILLNTGKSAERIRFDLAHELGHLLLHRHGRKNRSRDIELEANEFASSFLVPAGGLYEQIRGQLRLDDVFKLKRYWRVSAVAMVERLWSLEYLSEWTRRRWMMTLSERGYRSSEPDGLTPERSRLFEQLFDIAREDGWGVRRIAAELNVRGEDLDSLVFGLAISAVSGEGHGGPQVTGHLHRVK
jgi:Zn-dependent peptidase ImmA (M78 family)